MEAKNFLENGIIDIQLHTLKFSGTETSHNKHCQVPWKLVVDGPDLYTCTNKMLPSGEANNAHGNFWCATSLNDDLTYKDWDWCSSNYFVASIYFIIVRND